jgi:flagellar motility protein MotE (MotC chaperone)
MRRMFIVLTSLPLLLSGLGACDTAEEVAVAGPTPEECTEHIQQALTQHGSSLETSGIRDLPIERSSLALRTDQTRAEAIDELPSLVQREVAVTEREQAMEMSKEEMETRLKELVAVREEARALLAELDADREERVVKLVKMFQSMQPGQAADVLDRTEDAVAMEVLMRMNQAKAGRTLAEMDRDRAAKLTDKLGGAPLGK